ncbi:MAG: TadE family protein [Terracidiphilus sp.]|jgi:Flp pilus assembly protein TadG
MLKILNNARRQAMVLMRALNRGGEPGAQARIRRMGKRAHAYLRGGSEGGALVEFAVVVPLMLTVITGMFSVVMALVNYQQLGNATSNAALQLVTARGMITDPCASVVSTVVATMPSFTASKFTYTVAITDSSGTAHTFGPTAGSSFSCTAGAADLAQLEPATVTISYAYTWIPAYLLQLTGNLQTSTTVLVD